MAARGDVPGEGKAVTTPGAIRLLLADVDGTLVTAGGVLTESSVAAARDLREAGVALAITSGRPPRGMRMLIEPLALTCPIAGFNGGIVVNPDLSVIETHRIGAAAAARALALIVGRGLDAWIYTPDAWLILDGSASHVAREAATVKFFAEPVPAVTEAHLAQAVKIVGVSDDLPKSIVHRILEPAFRIEEQVRVVCREDRSTEAFLGELAVSAVDVVLSDAPAGPGTPIRAFSHLLGECGTAFVAAPDLARSARRRFPRSLDGAPFLLPGGSSVLRRTLEQWFASQDIRPRIVAELDDPALAKIRIT